MSRLRSNFQSGTLSGSVTDVATTATSAGFASLPAVVSPDTVTITVDPTASAGAPELWLITAHTALSTTVTMTRAQEGTTARSHAAGIAWRQAPTVLDFDGGPQPWSQAGGAFTNPRPANALRMSTYDTGASDPADDIEDALADAATVAASAGRVQLLMDSRQVYSIARAPRAGADGQLAQIRLPFEPWSFANPGQQTWIEIVGMPGGDNISITTDGADQIGTTIQSTLASASSPTYASTTGIASMIGGAASYSSINAAASQPMNSICPSFKNISLIQPPNPPIAGLDLGWCFCAHVDKVLVATTEFTNWASSFAFTLPTKDHAIGIQFPFVNCNPPVIAPSATVWGYLVGYGLGEGLDAGFLTAGWCQEALAMDASYHPNFIAGFYDVNCILGVGGYNPGGGASLLSYPSATGKGSLYSTEYAAGVVFGLWRIQWNNNQSAGFNRIADVYDNANLVPIQGPYSIVNANGGGSVPDGITGGPTAWNNVLSRCTKIFAGAPRQARERRTSGNITLSSTTFAAVDTGMDMVLDASPGDWIEVELNGVLGNEAVAAVLDVCTLVSGAAVSSFGKNAAAATGGVTLDTWSGLASVFSFINGSTKKQLTAADIVDGTVTLRVFGRVTSAGSKTLYADSNDPFDISAANITA